ncbi:MAG TPA: right-handed parallel beta-helix repeat-containing protein, partial [Polyangia bacterium]
DDAAPPADDAALDAAAQDDAPPAGQDASWHAPVHDYYVATTGDDAADGSLAHPWATIQHADTVAGPGDWVHVLPGTYGPGVVTAAAGSSALRVRYVSEQRWGAKIVATAANPATPWTIAGDYQDVVGFDISSTGSGSATPSIGVLIQASYARAIGNKVHDLARDPGCGSSGGAGIDASGWVGGGYAGSDNDTLGNYVYDIGAGTQCTTVHGIRHGSLRGRIQNNIVLHAAGYGIRLEHAATNVMVTNNTVMHAETRACIFVGGTGNDYPGGNGRNDATTVTNNLLVHCGSVALGTAIAITDNMVTGVHNLYANNLISDAATNACSLTNGTCVGTQTGAPAFVNDTGTPLGDYRIGAASPAVDHGAAACATGMTDCVPTVDFDCGARPVGVALDIGAFERGAAAAWPCSQ